MPVISVDKDPAGPSLTITSEFAAPVERVWQMWADPRQLERWWGPPTYPATVVEHDLVPGGRVSYYMTSPEGERYHGWWRVRAVEEPHGLELEDGFGDDQGEPAEDLPTNITTVAIEAVAEGRTRMVITGTYASPEALQQVLDMGMEEGITSALNQIDDLLAAEVAS